MTAEITEETWRVQCKVQTAVVVVRIQTVLNVMEQGLHWVGHHRLVGLTPQLEDIHMFLNRNTFNHKEA